MLPLVLVVTLVTMLPAVRGELVYDDLLMVAQNPLITDFGNVGAVFAGAYWDFLDESEAARIGYWRPLTAVALMVGHALGDGAPWAFHALSILCHLVATAAAFFLAKRLARSAAVGFWTALLFGLHPLHVESVAWITALNDPLFGAFALLALAAYVRWRDRGSRGVPLAAALLLVPALLAKELAAALPFMALAIDLARRPRGGWTGGQGKAELRAPLRAYATFAAVGIAYYLARVRVFGDWAAGLDRTTTDFGLSAARLALLRIELVGRGLWLLAVPASLNVFREVQPHLPLTDSRLVVALLSLGAGIAGGVFCWRRRLDVELAALLLVPAAMVPMLLRVESLGQYPLADRFLYMPALGAALLVALLARRLPGGAGPIALTVLAIAFGVRSVDRIGDWRDQATFHRVAYEQNPDSAYARWNLGRIELERYRESGDPEALRAAQQLFEGAQDLVIRAQRGDDTIYVTGDDALQANLGYAWSEFHLAPLTGFDDYETPRQLFQLILDRFPLSHEAYTGLGTALAMLERDKEAEQALKKALALHPSYPSAHHNLGVLLAKSGDHRRAQYHFEQALAARPNHLDDQVRLARSLFAQGWTDRAAEVARAAHEAHPEAVEPMIVLANAAGAKQDVSTALEWVDRALAVDPDSGPAHYTKGLLLMTRQEAEGAIVAWRRACDLLPRDFDAHYNLGSVLLASGARDAALPYVLRAYEIGTSRPNVLGALREALAGLRPHDASLAAELARLDRGRGDVAGAELWIAQALQANPDHANALFERAQLEKQRGETAALAQTLARVCALAPDWFQPHFDLGELYGELGHTPEAIEKLERALAIGPPGAWEEGLRDVVIESIEKTLAQLRGRTGPPRPPAED